MAYGYRIRMKCDDFSFPNRAENYLIHYGVPGQKWGVRNYQNVDGTMTSEGLARYRREHGLPANGANRSMPASASSRQRVAASSRVVTSNKNASSGKASKPKMTPAQIKARKAKVKKILAVSAGVAVAAGLGYAAYKKSTNLRDTMRKDILDNMGKGYDSINTLHSKYWDSADRHKFDTMAKERAKFVADNTTRADALAAKFYEKTGLQLNVPKSRSKVLAERRSSMNMSNFIRDAEKRGHLNKEIHDARANLKEAQSKLNKYTSTQHIGTSKKYEELWKQKHSDNVKMYKDILDNLLLQRKGG